MNDSNFDPAAEKYVSLATFRRNGAEVKTPVWIAQYGRKYYVFSAGDAGKVKRIRNSSRVRLAACSYQGRVRGEWVEARAIIVGDPALIGHVQKAFLKKYGWQIAVSDFTARLTGRMRRRAYIEIELPHR